MKNFFTLLLLLLFIFIFFNPKSILAAESLPSTGLGLSAGFQGGQVDLSVPIWLSANMQLSPRLGVIYQTKSLKEITLGLSAKYYPVKKTVSPFIAFNLGALYYERAGQYVSMAGEIIPLQNSVSGFTDFTFGPGFGGEYFINENFSVGIEGQLNFTAATQKSFQYSPGTLNFSTAALIYATVYF